MSSSVLADSTFTAGALQSAAAVAAVVFGWLLSVLTEQRSWRRRKTEQVRDRQLDALVGCLPVLGRGVAVISSLIERCVEVEAAEAAGGPASALLVREAEQEFSAIGQELRPLLVQLDAMTLELRLLGYTEQGVALLSSCSESLASLIAHVASLVTVRPSGPLDRARFREDLEAGQRALVSDMDRVLLEGVSRLGDARYA